MRANLIDALRDSGFVDASILAEVDGGGVVAQRGGDIVFWVMAA